MPLLCVHLPLTLPPNDPNPTHVLTFSPHPPDHTQTVAVAAWAELVPDPTLDGSPPLTPLTSFSDLSDADLYVWDLDDDDDVYGPAYAPPPYVDDPPDTPHTMHPPPPPPSPPPPSLPLAITATAEPLDDEPTSYSVHPSCSPSPAASTCSASDDMAALLPLLGSLRLPFPLDNIACPPDLSNLWTFQRTRYGPTLRTYELTVRQQPIQARMCGAGEKSDRRPVDPTPIIQLKVIDRDGDDVTSLRPSTRDGPAEQRLSGLRRPDNVEVGMTFMHNPYYFLFACLVGAEDGNDQVEELHVIDDGKTRFLTGTPVSSLYHLKDLDGSDAAFFVFPDLGVRKEGKYKFKMTLFEMVEGEVFYCATMYTGAFSVYSAKKFPGMQRATDLSKSFADQGLKIRVRKDPRKRAGKMTRRKASDGSDEEDYGHAAKRIRSSRAPETSSQLDSAPVSSTGPPEQYAHAHHSQPQGYQPAPHQQYQHHPGYPVGPSGQGMPPPPPPMPSHDVRRRSSAGYSPHSATPQSSSSASASADTRHAESRHSSTPLGQPPLHHSGMTRGPQGRHAPRSEGPAYGGHPQPSMTGPSTRAYESESHHPVSPVPWPQDRHALARHDSHAARYERQQQQQHQHQYQDQHPHQHQHQHQHQHHHQYQPQQQPAPQQYHHHPQRQSAAYDPPHSAGSHGSYGSAMPAARAAPSSYRSTESASPRTVHHDQIMYEQQQQHHYHHHPHHHQQQRQSQQYRASSSASSTRTGGTPSLTLAPISRTASPQASGRPVSSPHHMSHIMESAHTSGGGSSASALASRSAGSGSPDSVAWSASGSRTNRMGVDHLVD